MRFLINGGKDSIYSKIELYKLKKTDPPDNPFDLDIYEPKILTPTNNQNFIYRLIGPNSSFKRVLLKMGTGTGKTLASELVGTKYRNYKKVLFLGFTQSIFKNEALKHPELGFITYEEKYKLEELSSIAKSGLENDRTAYKEYKITLKRRITDSREGGYYLFYGYREFVSALFNTEVEKFESIEFEEKKDIKFTNMDKIQELIDNGTIGINNLLLDSIKDCLLICDEVHMTYNSERKNNYGMAIQYILDYHKYNITALFLSATIMNNNPREIIDIANMVKDPQIPYFISNQYFKEGERVDVHKLSPVIKVFDNRTVFLEELGGDFPPFKFEGSSVKDIDYLKFTQCDLSPLQRQTYNHFKLEESIQLSDVGILDFVFPNPDYDIDFRKLTESEIKKKNIIGLFGIDVKVRLFEASQSWKEKNGIEIYGTLEDYIITGPFLSKSSIGVFSSKYATLLSTLDSIYSSNPKCKILIFHPFVQKTGVKLLAEMLKWNGYLDEHMTPTDSSWDWATHKRKSDKYFTKNKNNKFSPTRFLLIHHKINDLEIEKILEKYNHINNVYGNNFSLLLGSQKIKQSLDFNSIQNLIILHIPETIPTYIQIRGRAIRRRANINLDPSHRLVHIYTFLSINTIEQCRYRNKIKAFKEIQLIEKQIHINALNNYIWNDGFYNSKDPLGALPYKVNSSLIPSTKNINNPRNFNWSTYFGDNYFQDDIKYLIIHIKSCFVSTPVWSYDDLLTFCRSKLPLLLESNFQIALHNIIFRPNEHSPLEFERSIYIDDTFIDYNRKTLDFWFQNDEIIPTIPKCIVDVGKYLIAVPLIKGKPIVEPFSYLQNNEFATKLSIDIVNKNQDLINLNLLKFLSDKSEYLYLLQSYSFLEFVLINICTKHIAIPTKVITLLRNLKLVGDSWYIGKHYIHKLISKSITIDADSFQTLNKEPDTRNESKPYIGILDNGVFKLRRGRENVKDVDLRKLEKGVICKSLSREYISKVFKELHLNFNYKTRCFDLFKHFVDMEISELNGPFQTKWLIL